MRNPELFNRTIDILVKAYQSDTLEHGDCKACAVGNIIGASDWSDIFCTLQAWDNPNKSSPVLRATLTHKQYGKLKFGFASEQAHAAMEKSGYSYKELSDIEWAFETAPKGSSEDEWMFNGLMAVVDTLMQIHEATPEEANLAKMLFYKTSVTNSTHPDTQREIEEAYNKQN